MLKIGIVGPGKVGTALAGYLKNKTSSEVAIYGRQLQKAEAAAKQLDIRVCEHLEDLIDISQIIFITTSDGAIEELSHDIALKASESLKGKVLLHCSGALAGYVLAECQTYGAVVGSIHPLMAFSGGKGDSENMSAAFLTVESNDPHNATIENLLKAMGNPYKWIEPAAKALYHGAAVVMSNYMVTLVEEGLKYLRASGFSDSDALSMMMPLMQGTLGNIEDKGTVYGLTGPILRGDRHVIESHISAVEGRLGKASGAFYRLMGGMTVEMIRGKRLEEPAAEDLLKLFDNGVLVRSVLED